MSKAKSSPVEAARALDRHLGQRLARRRRELGLSAADLDRALSGPPGTIARYENGSRSLGAAQLFALSRALEVPVLYFFEAVPAPPASARKGSGLESPPAAKNVEDAERFLDVFYKIPDARVRRDILGLLKAAAGEGEAGSA